MKIDFLGTYSSLQRVITPSHPKSAEPSPSSFEQHLVTSEPQPEAPASPKISSPEPKVKKEEVDTFPRARFSPDRPELVLPSNNEVIPPEIKEAPPVTPSPLTPPNILDARRIRVGDAFESTTLRERMSAVHSLVGKAGGDHGVDPALGMAVVSAESSFNAKAVSKDGHTTKGLFQLQDSTGMRMMDRLKLGSKYDPFDPKMNVNVGVGYLRYLHDVFSQPTTLKKGLVTHGAANSASLEKLAVAAFNAGEGRVAGAQRRAQQAGLDPSRYENVERYLPESTRRYVSKVSTLKDSFDPPIG